VSANKSKMKVTVVSKLQKMTHVSRNVYLSEGALSV